MRKSTYEESAYEKKNVRVSNKIPVEQSVYKTRENSLSAEESLVFNRTEGFFIYRI